MLPPKETETCVKTSASFEMEDPAISSSSYATVKETTIAYLLVVESKFSCLIGEVCDDRKQTCPPPESPPLMFSSERRMRLQTIVPIESPVRAFQS